MAVVRCAFCNGEGKDPFNLLSHLAICQACSGKGVVTVEEPSIKCVYCNGAGKQLGDGRVTCLVCWGKGVVTIEEPTIRCPECNGNGKTKESKLPCLRCKGKGLIKRLAG